MKVFNLTDVPTKVLEQRGLVNRTIVVGKLVLVPGAHGDSEDTPHIKRKMDFMLKVGALATGTLPPPYALAKAQLQKSQAILPESRIRPVAEAKPAAASGSDIIAEVVNTEVEKRRGKRKKS